MKHVASLQYQPISASWAPTLLAEFLNFCQASLSSNRISGNELQFKWIKLQLGQFRLDVNAGFNDHKSCFTFGAIIWNCQGNIVVAMVSKIRNP